jgi:ABC-2 type transport system permease protein
MRTLERLATSPITAGIMIFGDILASLVFCAGIACIPLLIAFGTGIGLTTLAVLFLLALLGALCFSDMDLLYSAPRFNAPSDVMMIASLVKFSLVFISGVFIPLADLPAWGRFLAMVSPLTYFMDLTEYLLQGSHYLPVALDVIALPALTALFIAAALAAHKRTLSLKI